MRYIVFLIALFALSPVFADQNMSVDLNGVIVEVHGDVDCTYSTSIDGKDIGTMAGIYYVQTNICLMYYALPPNKNVDPKVLLDMIEGELMEYKTQKRIAHYTLIEGTNVFRLWHKRSEGVET